MVIDEQASLISAQKPNEVLVVYLFRLSRRVACVPHPDYMSAAKENFAV